MLAYTSWALHERTGLGHSTKDQDHYLGTPGIPTMISKPFLFQQWSTVKIFKNGKAYCQIIFSKEFIGLSETSYVRVLQYGCK